MSERRPPRRQSGFNRAGAPGGNHRPEQPRQEQAARGGTIGNQAQAQGGAAIGIARDSDVIYGRNAVLESLRAGRRRHRRLLLAGSGPVDGDEQVRDPRISEMQQLAREIGIKTQHVLRPMLDKLVVGNHQGVALETGPFPYAEDLERPDRDFAPSSTSVWLALDGLQDPQNVGTLLRAAEAFGIAGVVIPQDRAAHITPAVVNASAGAVEHLSVARITNLSRWLQQARNAGVFAVGLDGVPEAEDITTLDLRPPIVLVVGAEGSGLRRLVAEQCDALARIPMVGQIESLNAAVAGSIGLWEIVSMLPADSEG